MSETIFELIEKPRERKKKEKMYRSKYPGTIPPTSSSFGYTTTSNVKGPTNVGGEVDWNCSRKHIRTNGTFGPKPEGKKHRHHLQVTKGKGADFLPKPQKFSYNDEKRKPQVPKRTEGVITGEVLKHNETNFVVKNAIANILMEPPEGKRVPDRSKTIFKHENFGKVPDYLAENQKLIQQEKDLIAQAKTEVSADEPNAVTVLPEKERQELLAQLKTQWEQTNAQYQQMTHLVQLDTIGKVRRKERFESTLTRLEKDIETLSKKCVIVREC